MIIVIVIEINIVMVESIMNTCCTILGDDGHGRSRRRPSEWSEGDHEG